MRIEAEPAYVLHARPWRESSLLVEVLSAQHGRLGLVARGVQGPEAPRAARGAAAAAVHPPRRRAARRTRAAACGRSAGRRAAARRRRGAGRRSTSTNWCCGWRRAATRSPTCSPPMAGARAPRRRRCAGVDLASVRARPARCARLRFRVGTSMATARRSIRRRVIGSIPNTARVGCSATAARTIAADAATGRALLALARIPMPDADDLAGLRRALRPVLRAPPRRSRPEVLGNAGRTRPARAAPQKPELTTVRPARQQVAARLRRKRCNADAPIAGRDSSVRTAAPSRAAPTKPQLARRRCRFARTPRVAIGGRAAAIGIALCRQFVEEQPAQRGDVRVLPVQRRQRGRVVPDRQLAAALSRIDAAGAGGSCSARRIAACSLGRTTA